MTTTDTGAGFLGDRHVEGSARARLVVMWAAGDGGGERAGGRLRRGPGGTEGARVG